MAHPAARLGHLRAERDLTQEQLARRAGLTTEAVRRLEKGKTQPQLRTLYRLARALDVSVEELSEEKEREAS